MMALRTITLSMAIGCGGSTMSNQNRDDWVKAYEQLSPAQQASVLKSARAYAAPKEFWRNPSSNIINDAVLNSLGDRLVEHHSGSRQALSKDRFEFAFERALQDGGFTAELAKSRTNRGHDLTVDGTFVNLKTEAAAGVKDDLIYVSKWMELGRGPWDINFQRQQFLDHLKNYDRIFTLRRLASLDGKVRYELVEIPKRLMLDSENWPIELAENTKQETTPAYVRVKDEEGSLKYSLYFDAGSERKLQIRSLSKAECIVHATWTFDGV
jgi:restriction endonuclease SmaI-like protein